MDNIDQNFPFCIVYFLVFSKFNLQFSLSGLTAEFQVFVVLGRPKLGAVLQILHRYQSEGKKHFPQAAGYTRAIIASYTIGFHCCKATLLPHVQFVVHQTPTYFTAKSLYFCVYIMASKMALRRFFSSVDFCQYRFQGLVDALPRSDCAVICFTSKYFYSS